MVVNVLVADISVVAVEFVIVIIGSIIDFHLLENLQQDAFFASKAIPTIFYRCKQLLCFYRLHIL